MNPEQEDKIAEAMEQLRISYNIRQWRVCALICDSLSEEFDRVAKSED